VSGLISIAITFFNKAVLSYYKYPYPLTLTLAQIIFSLALSASMKALKLISYPDFSFATLQQVFPCSQTIVT